MSLKIRHSVGGGMAIDAKVPNQLVFNSDGSVSVAQRSSGDLAGSLSVSTLADIFEYGGKPKFSVEVWPGLPDYIPQGYIQSSGQQLLDIQFPEMRTDIVNTQYFCTEAEWQADPYKRATHWSLGDGDETTGTWMRCPDKNGVQPGNVGAFYGVGSNPAGALTGTAVTDAGRNLTGTVGDIEAHIAPNGAFKVGEGTASRGLVGSAYGHIRVDLDASLQWPVADEFRPRTWYGIWMIRMYGRVLNPGAMDAAGLNARMDMIDSRVSTLENVDFSYQDRSSQRTWGATYTNGPKVRKVMCGQHINTGATRAILTLYINGLKVGGSNGTTSGSGFSSGGNTIALYTEIPPFAEYWVSAEVTGSWSGGFYWMESE